MFQSGWGETPVGVPPLPGSTDAPVVLNRGTGIARFYFAPLVAADGKIARSSDGTPRQAEYVQILIPGDHKTSPAMKVTDTLRERYRDEYDRWKRGQEVVVTGTPLEMWPAMAYQPAQVAALKQLNVYVVEQLAELNDQALGKVGLGARKLRDDARLYLEAQKSAEPLRRLAAENEDLRSRVEQLQGQVEALVADAGRGKKGTA